MYVKKYARADIWILAFAGMTNIGRFSSRVAPAKAGVQEETSLFNDCELPGELTPPSLPHQG
jgi:hypothetical protein